MALFFQLLKLYLTKKVLNMNKRKMTFHFLFLRKKNLLPLLFTTFFFLSVKIYPAIVWQLPPERRASLGHDSQNQIILTDDSGKNVAIIWKSTIPAIQATVSHDFGLTWTSAIDLSGPSSPQNPHMTMTNNGQYIYGIWERKPGAFFQIEFSRSIDFGNSWTPISSVKVLSDPTLNANAAKIATNSTGEFVYAIWKQISGANSLITTSRSTDFGNTWPAGSSAIQLSQSGKNASSAHITTNSSGQYVYAAWIRQDDITSKTRVQISRSVDFGISWTPPGSVTTLSADDQNASRVLIKTDNSGKYVFVVWEKIIDASNTNIQFARSSDSGKSFSSIINIASNLGKAIFPDIAIDDTGQYIYIVYQLNSNTIQLSKSTDFGATFSSPITISTGNNNKLPKITTNKIGNSIYVIWIKSSSQIARFSSDFGQSFSTPQLLTGSSDSFLTPSITTNNNGTYVYAAFDITDINTVIYSVKAIDQLLLTTPMIKVFRK